uniref:Chromatin assembly factor 1, subunit A (p150) n=1 Tax=Kryptolebias marmoratus TaxID=37003 RepID=A0A3Q2ZYV0_KRYMA
LLLLSFSSLFYPVFLPSSGMDCKSISNANKKLIQARLPFKRLNTEPKENQPPKRPCAHACPGPEVSTRQAENESSPLSERSRPPLVNGRGPLDGFLSRKHPPTSDEKSIVDLTEDSSSSPVKCPASPPPASPCPPTKDKHRFKDRTSNSGNSPERTKTDDSTPASTPIVCSNMFSSLQEQEERLRLRQEKERQKEEAKAAKQKQKEEARKLKEEREKEKREKREKEEKEKAERNLGITCIDRLKAEKAEITRFLQKSKIQQAPKTLAAACGKFAPFEIKENMSLAPLTRVQCEESVLEELDRCLLHPAENSEGLKDWIGQKPRRSGPTKTRQTGSDCVIVDGPKPDGIPDRKRCGAMKLLQFHENYRPAYWGTWSKKTSHISPRCPFRQDKDIFDYEVDSDEEWEEEEPGESLSHSEGEDEEEGGDDEDDDDDGFFVPHGYLSNDEGALEEEEGGDLEKQKLRQTLKAREWDELMSSKKKMKVLEPVVRGCVWEADRAGLEAFQLYAVCLVEPLPTADSSPSPEELLQKGQREEQLLGQLLPLLHGNPNSSKVIINEFQEFCRQQTSSPSSPSDPSSPQSSPENIPTRIQLKRLIKKSAVYEKRSSFRRCCWYVHAEVLSRFGQEALPVPCQWTHVTTGAREEPREEAQAPPGSQGNSPTTPQTSAAHSSSNKRKSAGSMSITKFMKRCTDSEQTEADGFQADTEDDCEEDCVIISTQSGEEKALGEGDGPMEVSPSDSAVVSGTRSVPAV